MSDGAARVLREPRRGAAISVLLRARTSSAHTGPHGSNTASCCIWSNHELSNSA